jgi:hypothetical protein
MSSELDSDYEKYLKKDTDGYIYIIKTRECVRMKEDVYKIGRTEDILQRIKQYPKGSYILYTCYTNNMRKKERAIKSELKKYLRDDLGTEYFQINLEDLKKIIESKVNIVDKMYEHIRQKSMIHSENEYISDICLTEELLKDELIITKDINDLTKVIDIYSVEELLKEEFIITKDINDLTKVSDIIQFLDTKNTGMSATKIGKELTLLTNFKSGMVRINGELQRVRFGIKKEY